jgi:hypothetical protein
VEVTHFNTRAQEALKRCGFNVNSNTEANPKVLLSFSDIEEPIECFSKLWNDEHNPQSGFIAIMVCSEAELACPYIPTAKKRLSITYDDPKDFDDTVLETTMYDARCLQIATEIFYTYRQLINEI